MYKLAKLKSLFSGRSLSNFPARELLGIPKEFSAEVYRSLYKDLGQLTDKQLAEHYELHGRSEGRRAYPFTNRLEFAKFFSNENDVLELSPWSAPFFSGSRVKYADVLSYEDLVERAKIEGLDGSSIPTIDFVVSPTNLSKSIALTFDIVASSHVIEHQPDLVNHLSEVGKLLKDNGLYLLVIPDKRYCFDHFLNHSTIADVLEASNRKLTRHTLRSVIEHLALTTHNEPVRHWAGDHGEEPNDSDRVTSAIDKYNFANGDYLDVHAWYFTPESFRKIINQSGSLGFHPFTVEEIFPTYRNNLEFYAILRKIN